VRQGPAHLVDAMKGYWGYFHNFFSDGTSILKLIRKTQRTEQYRNLINHFFNNEAKWRRDHA